MADNIMGDKLPLKFGAKFRHFYSLTRKHTNRPRSIYHCSNMAPRLSGQTSIFGVVFFLFKSFWELRDKSNMNSLHFSPESLGAMLEY